MRSSCQIRFDNCIHCFGVVFSPMSFFSVEMMFFYDCFKCRLFRNTTFLSSKYTNLMIIEGKLQRFFSKLSNDLLIIYSQNISQ